MNTYAEPVRAWLHPVHATALAGALSLFLCTWLADYAYWSSHEVQWVNFANWLNVGGLLLAAIALASALFGLRHADRRRGRPLFYLLVLLAAWVLALFNAFIHVRDAWGSMPTALVLSAIVALLACIATWIGMTYGRSGGAT